MGFLGGGVVERGERQGRLVGGDLEEEVGRLGREVGVVIVDCCRKICP